MNISPKLKQEVHLFLHSYVGYLEAVKIQDLYLSLVEGSRDATELEENVKRTFEDVSSKGDRRFAEALVTLNEKIKRSHF